MHSNNRFKSGLSLSPFTSRVAPVAAVSSAIVLLGSLIVTAAALHDVGTSVASGVSVQATKGATIDETKLKPRTTSVRCMGVDAVELDGVLLKVDSVAIQAMQECKVQIKNSHIVGRPAVMAAGKASITIENSIVEGNLQLSQDSVTSVHSSTMKGRVRKLQTAEMKDLGQNVWP